MNVWAVPLPTCYVSAIQSVLFISLCFELKELLIRDIQGIVIIKWSTELNGLDEVGVPIVATKKIYWTNRICDFVSNRPKNTDE